jgi:hypothetical protein
MPGELENEIGEHYAVEDGILPVLKLDSPVSIRIDIRPDGVALYIGPRDWYWQRGCPDLSGCGTLFDPPIADESN